MNDAYFVVNLDNSADKRRFVQNIHQQYNGIDWQDIRSTITRKLVASFLILPCGAGLIRASRSTQFTRLRVANPDFCLRNFAETFTVRLPEPENIEATRTTRPGGLGKKRPGAKTPPVYSIFFWS